MILRTLGRTLVLTLLPAGLFATAASAHVQLVTVTMSNYSFAPATMDLLAGSDYQLHLVNTTNKGHDFSAPELFADSTVAPDDRAKVKDGSVEVDAGATVDIRFTPGRKGTYKFRCTHFLHATFGMTGTATVE
ncbi:MAG TPA: cupredoxin domain-containing protein [Rhizomicrobium sp.]|nr:cupredoxin domain-containing protein [Rhizomicrobium sp.]